MTGGRPQLRLTRLVVVLAGAAALVGLLAMHGLAPAHDLMALRASDGHAAPDAMTGHPEPTHGAGAAHGDAVGPTAVVGPSPASPSVSVSVSVSAMLTVSAGWDVARAAAHVGAGPTTRTMGHGAAGACLAILGAGVLVAKIRRRSASWLAVGTLGTTVAARVVHALRAPHLRCRAPSHLELCVWRT